MRELLDRISQNVHWVIFLLLEVLSGFMLFKFNHYQGSVWFTQANAVAGKVLEWEAKGLQYMNLGKENAYLVRQNILLQNNLNVLRHELAELKKDTSVTQQYQIDLLKDIEMIPAQVISNSVRQRDNLITINVGSNDGVEPEMGVISGTGVVGIVSKVTPHYALVLSVLNSRSSISCRLRGTEYFGYMKWNGGNPLQVSMDDVPRHAKPRIGDIVETSGFSSLFPAGIFLGRVAQIHNSGDGLAYSLEIQMGTDIAHVQNVCVLKHQMKEELDSLRRQ
ncbi:MAG: rod shape-determining protein MreC [Bacteroidaceae bacterium]|nr:rod shape-determining protein MreC [Bacteroidaceae bacterium]MBR1903376.1 rod shape-determining protein MreC [Bacteroidaceae bacterium]